MGHHRHEIFDDDFQAELESTYRDTGAGSEPVPPAQLAMALLLQGYLGLSDADGGGKKIREGVAEDRRVSVDDPEMRSAPRPPRGPGAP